MRRADTFRGMFMSSCSRRRAHGLARLYATAVLPWLAIRVGVSVFDDDSSFNAGVRAYFGGNLF